METTAGGVVVRGYPALVEEPGPRGEATVALRVLADAGRQAAEHRRGVRRLLLLETALSTKINDTMQMKAAFSARNDTNVPDNKKNTDTQTSLTLVYSF